jgi:adenine-specific DNA-methyltransferase
MIANGDCLDLLKKVNKESVDLVLTSPPYGIGKEYEKRSQTIGDYIEMMAPVVSPIVATIRKGGYLCWEVGTRTEKNDCFPLSECYLPLFRKAGLVLVNELIWYFEDNRPFGGTHYQRLTQSHETILMMKKPGAYSIFNLDAVRVPQKYPLKKSYKKKNYGTFTCNPLGKNPGDVWNIHTIHYNSPEKWDHPAQYPEELCRRIILLLTNEKGVVMDPFMGVGTTCFVAEKLGRKAIGFEINKKYFDEATLRMNGYTPKDKEKQSEGQLTLF